MLSSDEMDGLFAEWERALSTFDQPTQKAAKERTEKLIESFVFPLHLKCIKKNTITSSYLIRVKSWIKKLIGAPHRRENTSNSVPSEKKWQSALEIAGFY